MEALLRVFASRYLQRSRQERLLQCLTAACSDVRQLQREFNGTEHVYNCDSFNEMEPPSSDPGYLAEAGRATLAAMTGADPQAVW